MRDLAAGLVVRRSLEVLSFLFLAALLTVRGGSGAITIALLIALAATTVAALAAAARNRRLRRQLDLAPFAFRIFSPTDTGEQEFVDRHGTQRLARTQRLLTGAHWVTTAWLAIVVLGRFTA